MSPLRLTSADRLRETRGGHRDGGFGQVRNAIETPFNMVLEARL
jgi:hypothetical protein